MINGLADEGKASSGHLILFAGDYDYVRQNIGLPPR